MYALLKQMHDFDFKWQKNFFINFISDMTKEQ